MDDTHMLLIMWAWFFPKEETSQWIGHRYGWQSAVLALNPDDTTDGGIMGMALWNGDDGYDYLAPEKINYIQDHMILKYKAVKPNRYRIQSTNWIDKETRFDMPMVEWEMMPSQARQALQVFDFRTGKNKPECPVKDGIFDDRIKTAGEEIVKGTHGDGSSPNSGDVK